MKPNMKNPITNREKLDQWLDGFVTERKLWIATFGCTMVFLLVDTVERALLQFVVMAVIVFVYKRIIGFEPKTDAEDGESSVT
jgi:hypothetical protein